MRIQGTRIEERNFVSASPAIGYAAKAARQLILAGSLALAGQAPDAAADGTITFGNSSSSKVINGNTSSPVTTNDQIRAALYRAPSPQGTNTFTQIGAAITNVGYPLPGLFAGGTRTTQSNTPAGATAQFRVRAWGGGFPTYEQALTSNGVLVGQSAIIVATTGNPTGAPPTPPGSLVAGGLPGFTLTPNGSGTLTVNCPTNKTVACGAGWSFDAPTASSTCSPTNVTILSLGAVTNGSCSQVITQSWQITDLCGNTNLCLQIVTVVPTGPALLCSNLTIECGSASLTNPPAYADACCGSVVVSLIGSINTNSGQTYPGNGSNGFGGPIGLGSLALADNGTTVFGQLNKGPNGFNDALVIYLDTGAPGGFAGTSGFADNGDGLRQAISGFDGGANRSLLTFAGGFSPRYAIALAPASDSFGGLWQLTNGGANSLGFISSVNLNPTGVNNNPTYTFSCDVSQLGLAPNSGATLKLFATYVSDTGYRSDEAVAGTETGTVGWNPFQQVTFASYTMAGGPGCNQTVAQTWQAVDQCCNLTNICTRLVTIRDTTPPVITGGTNQIIPCGNAWTLAPPTALDACCGTNVSFVLLSTNVASPGPCQTNWTAVWQVSDCCSNSTICTQVVAVVNTNPPLMTCASNKTVACGTAWNFDAPSAFDTCTGSNVAVSVLSAFTNGSCARVATRAWIAYNPCSSAAATCTQVVTVVASPERLVAPNAQAGAEGNAGNVYPFNIGAGTMRYQQVFAASQFGGLPTGGASVTAITFRVDKGSGWGSFGPVTLPAIQINLSTTAKAPDGLSTTFTSNVGDNDTVVFSGPLTLSSAAMGNPAAFDVVIPLATPFFYNPASGNLLLDVRNSDGEALNSSLDAQSATGDPVSRLYGSPVTASTGAADSLGLIAQFTFGTSPLSLLCSNLTIACDSPVPTNPPPWTDACCDNVTVTLVGTTNTTSGCTQFVSQTWQATDCCSNSALCTQVITVVPAGPTLACSNFVIECGSSVPTNPPSWTDACCTNVTVTLIGSTTTNSGCTQTISQTWQAVDLCCNLTNTCTQTITVVDTTPPIVTGNTNRTVECGSGWTWVPPTAYDTCCGADLSFALLSSNVLAQSVCQSLWTATWEITDCCSNSTICTQLVTAVDTTPPLITGNTNRTVQCGSVWTLDPPTAFDACCGSSVSFLLLSTNVSSAGPCQTNWTAVWQVSDCCTNSTICTQTVMVVDSAPPVMACTSNKTVNCSTNWTFDPPSGVDACTGSNVLVSILSTLTNGGCPRVAMRTWIAYNTCSNASAVCTQAVTLVDTTPPVIACSSNLTVTSDSYWSFVPPSAYDSCCGSNVTVTLLSTNAAVLNYCTTVWKAIWQASDCCSNTSTCTQTVTVVPPVVLATNSWVNLGATGNWGTSNNWSLGRPPQAGDFVLVTNPFNKTVIIDSSASPCTLTVSNFTLGSPGGFGSNTLALANGPTNLPLHVLNNLTVEDGGTLAITNSHLLVDGLTSVGNGAAATLTLVSGTAQSGSFALGATGNSLGQLNLGGGILTSLGDFTLGSGPTNSTGVLNATGGAMSIAGALGIGNGGSTTNGAGSGSATFADVNVNALTLNVGSTAGGVGSLTLQSNAMVTISGDLNMVSSSLTTTSTITLNNGSLAATNGTTRIGSTGNGQMSIAGGNHTLRDVRLGGTNGLGDGSLLLLNGRLTILQSISANFIVVGCGDLDGSGGTVIVGQDHDATLDVTCGNATNVNTMLIGYTANYSGTFSMSGGLTLVTNTLIVGDTADCVNGPKGNVTHTAGFMGVTNASHTAVLDVRNGTFILNGGVLVADELNLSHPCGQFTYVSGTLHYNQLILPAGAPPLVLTITPDYPSATAKLSWPSPYVGYSLEQNPDLTTSSWTSVNETPSDDGMTRSVTVPIGAGNLFYRLVKP